MDTHLLVFEEDQENINIKMNKKGRNSKEELLAVSEALKAILWPTPGLENYAENMKEDQETGVLSRLIGGFGPMFIICSKHCGTVMIHGDVCALQVAQVMELLKPGGCWESSKNLQVHCSSMLPQPCSNYPNRRQQNFFFFRKTILTFTKCWTCRLYQ